MHAGMASGKARRVGGRSCTSAAASSFSMSSWTARSWKSDALRARKYRALAGVRDRTPATAEATLRGHFLGQRIDGHQHEGVGLPPKAFMLARSTCSWFMGSSCSLSGRSWFTRRPSRNAFTSSLKMLGCAPEPASALCCRNRRGSVDGLDGSPAGVGHVSWVLRPPLGLPLFHLVQPGLEDFAKPPEHAGEVRVVEGDHLRAVAPPRGARQVLPLRLRSCLTRLCPGACAAWPPRSRTAAGALPRRPRPSPSSPCCPTNL